MWLDHRKQKNNEKDLEDILRYWQNFNFCLADVNAWKPVVSQNKCCSWKRPNSSGKTFSTVHTKNYEKGDFLELSAMSPNFSHFFTVKVIIFIFNEEQ